MNLAPQTLQKKLSFLRSAARAEPGDLVIFEKIVFMVNTVKDFVAVGSGFFCFVGIA